MEEKIKSHSSFLKNHDIINKIPFFEHAHFTAGHNFFSDIAEEEFKKYTGFNADLHHHDSSNFNIPIDPNLEPECDWRAKGCVIRECQNQGPFGCCYAFSGKIII